MHFPTWVDRERDRRKRASLRLKYMLSHATLRKYGRTSIHDLARDVGCNHSSIFNAISRGWFTSELSLIHISEPTRLLSISYAVFRLKKKNTQHCETPKSRHVLIRLLTLCLFQCCIYISLNRR